MWGELCLDILGFEKHVVGAYLTHLFSSYSMEKQSLQSTYVVGRVGMEEKNTRGSPKVVRRLVKALP